MTDYKANWVLVTKDNCVFCDKAKELLAARGISFTSFSIEDFPIMREFVKANGKTTVPQVFRNGHWLGGFVELDDLFHNHPSYMAITP